MISDPLRRLVALWRGADEVCEDAMSFPYRHDWETIATESLSTIDLMAQRLVDREQAPDENRLPDPPLTPDTGKETFRRRVCLLCSDVDDEVEAQLQKVAEFIRESQHRQRLAVERFDKMKEKK